MEHEKRLSRYAASGMAAYLPGMQYMIELMQQQLDGFRAELARLQGAEEEGPPPERTSARGNRKSAGASKAWAGMSAAERSAEMKRRLAKGRKAKAARDDEAKAKYATLSARISRARKKAWSQKSEAEREAWKAKMAAGKLKAARAAKRALKASRPAPLALLAS